MRKKVVDGEIDIGEGIVRRQYQKISVSKKGELVPKTFYVEGRKHPLIKIRKRLFTKYHKFMRLNSDSYFENLDENELHDRLKTIGEFNHDENNEFMRQKLKIMERTRHLQVWHDASVIANHGHILFCVNLLYDTAVFYTSKEYKQSHGVDVNIQKLIENPELYIIGRCRDNDEQLGYIPTRNECLKGLSEGIKINELDQSYDKNIIINDVMRMFHGDGPASTMEAGNQKGGHYFCPSCEIHICQTDDISCSFLKEYCSFSDRQKLVVSGVVGKRKSLQKLTQPFAKLNVEELRQELISRNVDITHLKNTKKDLNPTLKTYLKGAKRVPILIMNDPLVDLKTLNLEKYEICTLECMHDIASHIENVLKQLPNFIENETHKVKYVDLFEALSSEKDRKRCCDWRRILLVMTLQLYQQINGKIHKLLRTLSEIQRILYLDEDSRTTKQILRLHNSCFEHYILMKEIFSDDRKFSENFTRQKLFGKYSHNLNVHAPIQYRIINGESINAEEDERTFNTIQNINKGKTNNHPGHLIGNMIVRHEYKMQNKTLFEFDDDMSTTKREISRLGQKLQEIENDSLFTHDYIKKNTADWQSHLERIADFLVEENAWWQQTEFGIQFFDFNAPKNVEKNPKVHHYRSANISTVLNDLKTHWSSIVENINISKFQLMLF